MAMRMRPVTGTLARKVRELGSRGITAGASQQQTTPTNSILRKVPWLTSMMIDSKKSGKTLTKQSIPKMALANAYEIQNEMIRLTRDTDGKICGWKVGATNETAMKNLGLSDPFRGPLFTPFMHRSGCTLRWIEQGERTIAIEVEFAFKMKHHLPPRATEYTYDEVWDAVSHVIPAIEIAASRVPMPLGPDTVSQIVADSGGNGCLVMGEEIAAEHVDCSMLRQVGAVLRMKTPDGEQKEVLGRGENVLGDPVKSLCWLVNSLRKDGIALNPGCIVTTGAAALLKPDQVPWGVHCTIEATLNGLPPSVGDQNVSFTIRCLPQ